MMLPPANGFSAAGVGGAESSAASEGACMKIGRGGESGGLRVAPVLAGGVVEGAMGRRRTEEPAGGRGEGTGGMRPERWRAGERRGFVRGVGSGWRVRTRTWPGKSRRRANGRESWRWQGLWQRVQIPEPGAFGTDGRVGGSRDAARRRFAGASHLGRA